MIDGRSDLPASLAVGDGAFKRRAVLAFRCCAAPREGARKLHQIVDGLCVCEWSASVFSHKMDGSPEFHPAKS